MSECGACGALLPPSEGPRPRKWCDDRCRKQAARSGPFVPMPVGSSHVDALAEMLDAIGPGPAAAALVNYARSLAVQLDAGAPMAVGREYRLAVAALLDLDQPDGTAEEIADRVAFLELISTPTPGRRADMGA